MPFPNWQGSKERLWTKENTIIGLKKAAKFFKGPLPSDCYTYLYYKKGRLDWPTLHRITEYFGTMSRAWLAAGVNPKRVCLNYSAWTPEEILFLKESAGEMTIKQMAKKLLRTYASVRRKMYDLNIKNRGNQGDFSALCLAKELCCSQHRVRRALVKGIIPGILDKQKNRWRIYMDELTPEMKEILKQKGVKFKIKEVV